MKEIIIKTLTDLDPAAEQLLSYIGERKVLTFEGEIGAGKTTFIKVLCAKLGVEEAVTSPTFSIVNEYLYQGTDGEDCRLYHMDIYRLEELQEAMDIGIEEYLDSGQMCLIEWPELIKPLLPDDAVMIKIVLEEDFFRKMLFL